MTVASDLCRCGGAPLKIPPILGVQQIFSKNYRKRTPLAFAYTRPYMAPRCYFHSDIPPGPSNTKRMALKKTQGGRRRRHRPRRAIAYIFSYIGENKIATPLGVFSARFRGRWVRGCMRHATTAFGLLVHRFGMISVGLQTRDLLKLIFGTPNWGYFEESAATSAQIRGHSHRQHPLYFLESKGF